ncbi:DUF3310 domain-containing protein [Metapseudomonas otitidis]|uniref:DUF3310 domain-containing protein n=1 Tax=Metapseudomonas otitidis TaxID=319939 RepID=UPI0026153459|nr:DUF3310 domain-containing protein [Pseudomonas otitidis]
MSAYSLTRPSEAALRMLIATGGSEQLILQRPANDLRANVRIDNFGGKPTAVISISSNTNSMTMQPDDGANAQHLADYIEALANGTADTAEFSNTPACVDLAPTDLDTTDTVNHPPHYNDHPSGIECIEVTELLPFNLGNAFKYVFRHRKKNGQEDLLKAEWYLTREQERPKRAGISIGFAQAARALAKRIAAHEPYPLGACLIAIADDQPEVALEWLRHLLAEA